MNEVDVVQFLRCLGTAEESIHVKPDWVASPCPLAPWTHEHGTDSHPSFAIRVVDGGESYYNCYACGSGDLLSMVEDLIKYGAQAPKYDTKSALQLVYREQEGGIVLKIRDYAEPEVPLDVPFDDEWLYENFRPPYDTPDAVKYLSKRGVSADTILDLDIRYDLTHKTVCFPIRNWDDVLVGVRGRYIHDWGGPRYHDYDYDGKRNKLPWFGEHWVDLTKPVVFVESVFDVAAVYPIYKNVVAPLSVGISKQKARRMSGATEIITMFDGDKGGQRAQGIVNKYFPDAIITHLQVPYGKDPGDMEPELLRELLGEPVALTI